jgi:rod shape-determining protein MreD
MIHAPPHGLWLIGLTFCAALLLAIAPMPLWIQWARPEWVALVLIYWVIALPQRVGVLVAFFLGLLVDVVEGAALGQNALALSVVAFLALVLYQRLRVFNVWQQVAVVFIMVGINQLLGQWVQNLVGVGAQSMLFLLPALVSALLWPLVMVALRYLRRSYRVS